MKRQKQASSTASHEDKPIDDPVSVLTDLPFLLHLPTVVLQMLADYAYLPPIIGRHLFSHPAKPSGSYSRSFLQTSHLIYSQANQELGVAYYDRGDDTTLEWGTVTKARSFKSIRKKWLGNFNGLYLDPTTGHIFGTVAKHRCIYELDRDGKTGRIAGKFIDESSSHPRGLAIDHKSHLLYVSDHTKHYISVFSLDTRACIHRFGSCGPGREQFRWPTGLTFDEDNRLLLIADTGNHRIVVIDPDNNFAVFCILGSYGKGDQQLDAPESAYLTQGEVIVADSGNYRIQIFSLRTKKSIKRVTLSHLCQNEYMRFWMKPTQVLRDPTTGKIYVSTSGYANPTLEVLE